MCFSANASFTTSAILSVVGASSILKASNRREMALASVPLLFSIQQFTEGVLWIELSKPGVSLTEKIMTYNFVIFGQLVWPIWLPWATSLVETNIKRKKLIQITLGFGVFIALTLLWLTIQHKFTPAILGHNIHYNLNYPDIVSKLDFLYFVPTVVQLFISSHRKIHYLGLFILVGYGVSYFFYSQNIFSVWCFFASAVSIYIYFILRSRTISTPPHIEQESLIDSKLII